MPIRPYLVAAALALSACRGPEPPATYAGGQACISCHEEETAAWAGSHHDRAMEVATDSTVLGDFNGAEFEYAGTTTTFFREGDRFLVRTDGPDGNLRDFEVLYTFGFVPLQQYLVALPGGRLQALPFAWDTRPNTTGWYHLYPDENVTVNDPLHWTGAFQNWNHMCADCHSTDLVKGYDADTRSFNTTWSDLDVSCEACHGPGSTHVAWARRQRRFPGLATPDSLTEAAMGLVVSVHDRTLWAWTIDPQTGVPKRTLPRGTDQDIPTCARCHARRASLRPEVAFGRPFVDTHILEPPVPPLYFADGQVLEEDYVYGSFLQSRMYRSGVTCSNCHEPHSLTLRAPGNLLCRTCHDPARYDTTAHHGHRAGTRGSGCVDCHMPETVYMGIDARRDHSFVIPRPALSRATGVPNPCTGCHTDRSDEWAMAELARLDQFPENPAFALAWSATVAGQNDAEMLLLDTVEDSSVSAVRRAGTLRLMRTAAGPASVPVVERALRDPHAYVRWAALDFLTLLPPSDRGRLGAPLLADTALSVRIEAARVLADPASRIGFSAEQRIAFDGALEEYLSVLRMDADRPESQTNLGLLRAAMGDVQRAETAFREAIALSAWFASAYVNLADVYRTVGRDQEGEALLRAGLHRLPDSADLLHALGLLLVRSGRAEDGLHHLGDAARLRPRELRFGYVYAIALNSAGRDSEAVSAVQSLLDRFPDDPELLFLLATLQRDRGRTMEALEAARRLADVAPADPRGAALVEQLSD